MACQGPQQSCLLQIELECVCTDSTQEGLADHMQGRPPTMPSYSPSGKVRAQQSKIRSHFVRKVHSLLFIQLFTATLICAVLTIRPFKQHFALACLANFATMRALVGVACCCLRRIGWERVDTAYMSVLICGVAIWADFLASMCTVGSVLAASFLACSVFLGFTAIACLRKSDLADMGVLYLFPAALALLLFALAMNIFSLVSGMLIFSLYVVHETRIMVGGRCAKFERSVDGYVSGAVNIYLDIVNLFVVALEMICEMGSSARV